MYGVLTEKILFNGLTLEPGTRIHFQRNQARIFKKLSPSDSIIVDVELKFYTIKALVKKSQVYIAA